MQHSSLRDRKIHFIGIGGIGVSALAQYYLAKGWDVTGCDLQRSEITDALKRMGVKVFIGKHNRNSKSKSQKSKLDLIVYTPAVPRDNPERKTARRLGIKCLSYPEALGELTKKYFTIAVSGSHGKSTTTAMIGLILIKAGFDPTVIVGTKLREFTANIPAPAGAGMLAEWGSNFRMGRSPYLVIEADEHFASFLHYWPKIIVVTNIEEDHLDYYKNLRNIIRAFKEFTGHLPKDGKLVLNSDDKNSKFKMQNAKLQCKIQNYSLRQKEAKDLARILQIPGRHNISNALAALTVARLLKIPDKITFKALSEYKGSWRRFEIKKFSADNSQLTLVSDYAHHPTEIKATLKAAREKFPGKKIWAVFQPHQYQRTFYLFDEFVKAFEKADAVVFTEIFDVAGREEGKISKKVSGRKLAEAVAKTKKEVYFIQNFLKIPSFLRQKAGKNDVIMIMGAGDIYKITDTFL